MLPRGYLWAILCAVLLARPAAAQAFDLAPLEAAEAFPQTEGFAPAWPEFREWLERMADVRFGEGDRAFIRELIYAHISADAKERYQTGAPPLPELDSTLAEMFSWGERYQAIGAQLVADKLLDKVSTTALTVPAGFGLTFDTVYTLVAERDSWRVEFPHYFMVGLLGYQTLPSGADCTIVMLSTLFARDSSEVGASQATILIASAPVPAGELAGVWLERFGLSVADTVPVPVSNAIRAYAGRDPSGRLRTELVAFAPAENIGLVFMYAGLPGTYETNRAHFIDLMNTLRVRRPIPGAS